MTANFRFEEELTSEEAFESLLGELLLAASSNGIDPEGSWTYRNEGSIPDWEALIVTLEKNE